MSNRLTYPARNSTYDRKGTRPNLPVPSPHRQKGLWNFLTWSFFISQVMAAETFAGSAARAAGATDNETVARNHADAHAGGGTLPAIGGIPGLAGDDATVSGPAASGPALAPLNLGDGSGAGNEKTQAATSNGSGDGGDGGDGGDAAMARASGAVGNQVAFQQAIDSHGTEPQAPLAPEDQDLSGRLVPVVAPLVGEHVVAPVVALRGEATEVLATTVEHVVAPVVGLVGDVVCCVLGSLTSVVEPAVAPIGEATEHALQPLANVVGETVSPAACVVELVVAPLAETLGNLLQPLGDFAGQHGIVASGGTIVVLELAPIGGLHLDELFSQGSYTSYNLALGTASTTTASATFSTSTSAIDCLATDQHVGEGQLHENCSSTPPLGILNGVLDDLHLRGFHDGLGL